jgi:uncharacterized membrane protein YfcA
LARAERLGRAVIGGYGPEALGLLAAAAFVAGLVRGFAGFGTAMIYLPAAGAVLPPFSALTTLALFDLVGPLPLIPRALREGAPRDVLRLAAGLALALPLGLFALSQVSPEVFRYAVSATALALLACLGAGLRYRGQLTPPLVYATGAIAGFLFGVAGIPGPPVILLYMASALPAQAIRANTLLFLVLCDVALLPMLALFGRLDTSAALIGVLLIAPNMLGGLIGVRLFQPGRERIYRRIAYAVIGFSAIAGLPLWSALGER